MYCFYLRQKVLWEARMHYMTTIEPTQPEKKKGKRKYWIRLEEVVALAMLKKKFEAECTEPEGYIQFEENGVLKMKPAGLKFVSKDYTLKTFFRLTNKQKHKIFSVGESKD